MEGYAKQQISELLARAAYALDLKQAAALQACFHKDARFSLEIAGVDEVQTFAGAGEIMGLMQGAWDAQTDERRHVISNLFYTRTAEANATVVSYLTLTATENGEIRLVTTGVYTDQVAKVGIDGGWQLMDRYLRLDRAY